MECKFIDTFVLALDEAGINRYIVECKWMSDINNEFGVAGN